MIDKWSNADVEELEWVTISEAGYHDDFTCCVREECDLSDNREATHYVRFSFEWQEKEDHHLENYFYTCKDCIADAYFEVNETDVQK